MEVIIAVVSIILPLAGTVLGWVVVGKQNQRSIERQELWQLLQELLTTIDTLADSAIDFHHTGNGNAIRLSTHIDKIAYRIAILTDKKQNKVIRDDFLKFKQAITNHNWGTKYHTLFPLESAEILDILSSQTKLKTTLLESYQCHYQVSSIRPC